MNLFLSGICAATFAAIGFYFFLFWRQGRDRFFLYFAIAWWLLAVERVPLAFVTPDNEFLPAIYLIRLSAFCLILYAIIDKNVGHRENA